jgi:hypothetical protein
METEVKRGKYWIKVLQAKEERMLPPHVKRVDSSKLYKRAFMYMDDDDDICVNLILR